ncbi:MAG TPA: hypothetical protein PK113_06030 [Bacillota bacterium]|nr:hypothetical protein [Bacillota bacterium]
MNRKKLILFVIYLINLIAVVTTVIFISENRFLNILLSIYLIFFTAIYIYVNRKKQ